MKQLFIFELRAVSAIYMSGFNCFYSIDNVIHFCRIDKILNFEIKTKVLKFNYPSNQFNF